MLRDGATTTSRQSALEWSLLAYSSSVTLLITLAPFRFRWPSSLHVIYVGPIFDVVANILLFVPPGFLYTLTRHHRTRTSARVFWVAFACSSVIEISQVFQPGRYPSPADVFANAVGAWAGARLCEGASRLLKQQWVGRLGFDLPLMNIVYLLVPLIWLDGLAAGDDSMRSYLTWILGLAGALVIGGVYRFGLKQPTIVTPSALALVVAAWFLAASLPTFLNLGAMPLVGCALVALASVAIVRLPVFGQGHVPGRRFEFRVLRRVWAVYGIYLLLLLVWPVPQRVTEWRAALGFIEVADDPPIVVVLQLLEHFSAFTLLGYMVAESHGRRAITPLQSMLWTCWWCGLAALVLEVLRGFHPRHRASVAQGALLLIGSAYGAWIYWRQLSRIRMLQTQKPTRTSDHPA